MAADAGADRLMGRLPRLDAPSVPQHVIVRGVNRHACFYEPGDFRSYLDDLRYAAGEHGCDVHAYVLMTNHVHLLVTGRIPQALTRMMHCLGSRYVRRFNASWRRTGTLFQGRFRACPIESERYLLTCMRYIELNPVRAGMVVLPTEYPWSSIHANAGLRPDGIVIAHDLYRRLGATDVERAIAYRAILAEALTTREVEAIRDHLNTSSALGSPAFQAALAGACGRRAAIARRGRPPRSGN